MDQKKIKADLEHDWSCPISTLIFDLTYPFQNYLFTVRSWIKN